MTGAVVARYSRSQERVLVQPSLDWEEQARLHFIHHYVVPPAAYRRGYLEFLPELLEQHPDHLALQHAFKAASMAQLANMENLAEVSSRAQSHYGLALRETARAMESPDTASTDCGLTSIILLQKYEVTCFQLVSTPD